MQEGDGYPGRFTLGELLQRGWLPPAGHWKRICEIVVDGTTLFDTRPGLRTPLPAETRYSKKFSEVLCAAHALARMDYGRVEILTGHERPDLRVIVDGAEIGIEVTEATEGAHAQATVIETNTAVQEAIAANPSLAPAGTYLRITRAAGRGTARTPSRQERAAIAAAIIEFLEDGQSVRALDDRIKVIDDWPGRKLGYVVYAKKHQYAGGIVRFDDSACTFDPHGMVEPVLNAIQEKRKLAGGYSFGPLWLIVGVTEPFGSFTESITDLEQKSIEISPFERVVVHDGGTFLELSAES